MIVLLLHNMPSVSPLPRYTCTYIICTFLFNYSSTSSSEEEGGGPQHIIIRGHKYAGKPHF